MNKHSFLLLSLVTFVRGRRSAFFCFCSSFAVVQGTIIVLSVILIYAANCYDYGDTSIWYFAANGAYEMRKMKIDTGEETPNLGEKRMRQNTGANRPHQIGGAAAIRRVTSAIYLPGAMAGAMQLRLNAVQFTSFVPEKSNGKGCYKTKMLDMSIVWHCHYAAIPLKLLHWYAPCVYTVIFLNTSGHRINHIIMWILRSPKRTSNIITGKSVIVPFS